MPEEHIAKINDYLTTLDVDLEVLINAAFVQEVDHIRSLDHARQQTNRFDQITSQAGERKPSQVIDLITAKKTLR